MGANVVYVSADHDSPALMWDELELDDACWILGTAPPAGNYLVRSRHTGRLTLAYVQPHPADDMHELPWAYVRFAQTQRRVAPGQSVVIYDGQCCLGGGFVASPAM